MKRYKYYINDSIKELLKRDSFYENCYHKWLMKKTNIEKLDSKIIFNAELIPTASKYSANDSIINYIVLDTTKIPSEIYFMKGKRLFSYMWLYNQYPVNFQYVFKSKREHTELKVRYKSLSNNVILFRITGLSFLLFYLENNEVFVLDNFIGCVMRFDNYIMENDLYKRIQEIATDSK